jgi:hypothetical protein
MTLEPVAAEIHAHLLELQAERALASIEGLAANSAYAVDLDSTRWAFHRLSAMRRRNALDRTAK